MLLILVNKFSLLLFFYKRLLVIARILWLGAHIFIMDSITENNLLGCPANPADLISALQQCHHQNSLSEKGMGQLLMCLSAFQLVSIYLLAPGL